MCITYVCIRACNVEFNFMKSLGINYMNEAILQLHPSVHALGQIRKFEQHSKTFWMGGVKTCLEHFGQKHQ